MTFTLLVHCTTMECRCRFSIVIFDKLALLTRRRVRNVRIARFLRVILRQQHSPTTYNNDLHVLRRRTRYGFPSVFTVSNWHSRSHKFYSHWKQNASSCSKIQLRWRNRRFTSRPGTNPLKVRIKLKHVMLTMIKSLNSFLFVNFWLGELFFFFANLTR